jgi:hypothetical protein
MQLTSARLWSAPALPPQVADNVHRTNLGARDPGVGWAKIAFPAHDLAVTPCGGFAHAVAPFFIVRVPPRAQESFHSE